MRFIIIAALGLWLGGCVPSSILSDRAIEQNVTIGDINDAVLVANILRARDQAPLHFGDVPLIHESYQVSGGATGTFGFGPHAASTSIAPTISVQEAPSFDMSNLDTQEFITGVMSPVKPGIAKYWLDRGLDDRLALLLFFSSVTITVGKDDAAQSLTINNDPRDQTIKEYDPSDKSKKKVIHYGFSSYLKLMNSITTASPDAPVTGQIKVVETPDLAPVGPPFTLDTEKHLKELSKIDATKYEIDPIEEAKEKDTERAKVATRAPKPEKKFQIVQDPVIGKRYDKYQLFQVSDKKVIICFNFSSKRSRRGPADQKACSAGGAEIKVPAEECSKPEDFLESKSCSATLKFALRSAGDVVHFLGDLLWLQQPGHMSQEDLNNPITLGYCGTHAPPCPAGGALFDVSRAEENKAGRFNVPYRDGVYTVPTASGDDHTLQVLAITSQLINLNKSAKELRSTPTVQIVP